MQPKDIIALSLLLLALPAGIILASLSQRARDAAFFAMVAATVVTDRLDVNFISHYWYHGTTRGLEFSFVDVLAISVFISSFLIPRPGESRFYWPAGFGLMLLFLLYACASVMFSFPKIYGFFELSKMLRGLFFFLAAALYIRSQREVAILVLALCCAVCFEGVWSIKQRLITGVDRVPGTLDHANSLSMYICTVSPIFVAAANATLPKFIRLFSIAAIGAAAVAIVLTVSRAGVPIFLMVMFGVTAFCISWRITAKKILASALVALCLGGLFIKTWGDLKERYAEATFKDEYLDDEQEGRGYYLRMARAIVEDKFFGVGLNNWSFWVAKKYGAMIGRPYDGFDEFLNRIPDDTTLENMVWPAPAHNLAALTVGELGIPGLLLFMLLWARWFHMGLRFLFKKTPEAMHRLGVGLFFGLCGIFLQSVTEWTFRQTHIFLTFNILIGALASLCYAKRRARKPAPVTKTVARPAYELAGARLAGGRSCA